MGTGHVEDLAWLARMAQRHPPPWPEVFVETGTYEGKTTRLALRLFRQVYTVELSRDLFEKFSPELGALGVTCFLGDSADVLDTLSQRLQREVFFYLDAHANPSMPSTATGPLPLWEELRVLAARKFHDIIAIDDVASFGHGPTPDWDDVNETRIRDYFPGAREVVQMGDQLVIYR